jgi:FkbM family methyltransferase
MSMEGSVPVRPVNRKNTWRGYLLAAGSGLALLLAVMAAIPFAFIAYDWVRGKPLTCDLKSTLGYYPAMLRLEQERDRADAEATVKGADPELDLVQVHTTELDFWVKRSGEELDGRRLIGYLVAEHRWMEESNPEVQVRPGDVVLDCGAHVGVFTHSALRRGASKVVAFEIDPVNLECFRRNFQPEIAAGRVVVVPSGVWNAEGEMDFTISTTNSGMGSLVMPDPKGKKIRVPLTRIDTVMAELSIEKVNFLKMDIEGAEREALAGAAGVLRRSKPILALDAYHRPDDPVVLPRVIRQANPSYVEVCGPCERTEQGYRPHALYFR